RALAGNPNDPDVLGPVGTTILGRSGLRERGIELARKVLEVDPFPSAVFFSAFGRNLYLVKRYEESVSVSRRCIAVSIDYANCYVNLSAALAQLGRLDEARATVAQLLKLAPSYRIADEIAGLSLRFSLRQDVDHFADGLRKAGLPE